MPRISVIIPCFNLGHFIDEAVQSVLAQSFQDFEILILDDGSTDAATVERLASLSYPGTRVCREPNRGLAAARNFLIARASGEFLCALDADDRLHPEYFAKALQRFAADPGLTFVSAWLREFGSQEGVWRQDRCDLATLLAEDTVLTAALVRRDVIVALGGYDEHMPSPGNEDWDLWIRVVKAGHRGTIIPEELFYYRKRPNSMSAACTSRDVHLETVRYLFRKHEDAYRQHLRDVLLWQDQRIAAALRENDALERRRDSDLGRTLAALRAERDRLARRVAASAVAARPGAEQVTGVGLAPGLAAAPNQAAELNELRAECNRARDEVRALRSSMSWRVTAPLRRICDAWPAVRPRGRS